MIATPPTPLDQFRVAVMADAAAQARLAELHDLAIFEARALALAAARGIVLTASDLHPTQSSRHRLVQGSPGPGWLPLDLADVPEPLIEWVHFADISPNSPFFEDAARAAANRPFNRLFRIATPLASLAGSGETRAPSGLIFHMSRCGSTLVSQMLAAMPGTVSISEAPPIDAMIRRHYADPEAHAEALRSLVHTYRRGAEHFFVKLDSWHALALPLLRRAFPDTPWIFLYRDPVEVMVSHLRQRGAQTVPGIVPLDWFGFAPQDAQLPRQAFIAKVLERICGAVLQHDGTGGMLANYADLPDSLFSRILPHFGITPDAAARAAIEEAAGRNSKAPQARFRSDSSAKQQEADADTRATAKAHLGPVFAALEARRNLPGPLPAFA